MANTPCSAIGRVSTSGKQILVRLSPGAAQPYLGALPLDVGGYAVLEARDAEGVGWLRLGFVGDLSGWVRADEIDLVGDCSALGFGVLTQPTRAVSITPGAAPVAPPTPPPAPTPVPTPPPAPVAPPPPVTVDNSPDRIRRAAFNITAGFEGGGYATYQNIDDGIISYGRFQFTLQSGSLFSVLDRFLQRAAGALADELRAAYAARVQARDAGLRQDPRLRELLIRAADDPIMQTVQDEIATEVYWNRVQDLSIAPRGIATPLGQALLFDMAINHGVFHDMIGRAEEALGVRVRSRVGENGVSEIALITRIAAIRQERMRQLADRLRAPGLIPRGDFWVRVVTAGDWNLTGDADGTIEIKTGRRVQVRQP